MHNRRILQWRKDKQRWWTQGQDTGNFGAGESAKLLIVVHEEKKEATITLPAAPEKLEAVEFTFKLHFTLLMHEVQLVSLIFIHWSVCKPPFEQPWLHLLKFVVHGKG